MQCFICGEPMRVVLVEPHQIDMPGFELRTFQCVGCGDVEKHPVFDSGHSRRAPALAPEPVAAAAPAASEPSVRPEPRREQPAPPPAPAPSTRKKSLFAGFAKLRGSKQAEP